MVNQQTCGHGLADILELHTTALESDVGTGSHPLFRRFVKLEQELLALLQTRLEQDQQMGDKTSAAG